MNQHYRRLASILTIWLSVCFGSIRAQEGNFHVAASQRSRLFDRDLSLCRADGFGDRTFDRTIYRWLALPNGHLFKELAISPFRDRI